MRLGLAAGIVVTPEAPSLAVHADGGLGKIRTQSPPAPAPAPERQPGASERQPGAAERPAGPEEALLERSQRSAAAKHGKSLDV